MSTYIPSAYGRAMEKASENILQLIMAGRQRELELMKIAQEGQRIQLAERQISAAERSDALQRFMQMATFAPADRPLAEIPVLHEDFKTLWPSSDPTNVQDAGGLVLHEGTLEDIVRPLVKEGVEGMSAEELARFQKLATYRAGIGEATTGSALDLAEQVTNLRRESLGGLVKDPKFFLALGRNVLGFPEQTTVKFPNSPPQTFNSPQEAQMAVSIWQTREQLNFYESRMNKQQVLDLAGDLMDNFNKYSKVGKIGRAAAQTIVSLAYGEGGGPQKLADAINGVEGAPKLSSQQKAAAVFFVQGARLADDGIAEWVKQMGPAGAQLEMMFRGAKFLGGDPKAEDPEDRGMGLPATEVSKFLPGLMRYAGSAGVPNAPSVRPSWLPNWGTTWNGITLNQPQEQAGEYDRAKQAVQDAASGKKSASQILDEFGTALGNRILRDAQRARSKK